MKEITPSQLADLLRGGPRAAALTGAGISVESGIPDFRSPGGLWERFNPMEYAHIRAFRAHPAKVWTLLKEMDETINRARPNPAHFALAQLEAKGILTGVITQNVDNLHQAAGSVKVVEYHGNALRFVCLDCGAPFAREALHFDQAPLYCPCGGLIKPDVVFFGEGIPPAAQQAALVLAQSCDLMLIVGTSGEVAPANYLPLIAKEHGATIVENNLDFTLLTRRVTDFFLPGPAGEVLSLAVKGLAD